MKACSRCGVVKPLEAFSKATGYVFGVKARCKDCEREHMRKYNASAAGREVQKRRVRAPRTPEYFSKQSKSRSRRLTNDYIKIALTKQLSIRYSEVPNHLIEIKREQLIMRRLARQLKKASNESSKDTD